MKKLLIVLSVLCCILLGAAPAHTDDFYINDYASILTNQQAKEMQTAAEQLAADTTAQVVVLTLKDLEGKSISDYSLETFREWGIGSREKNNGVLILLSTGERKVHITVGYGLEGRLNDAKCGRFLDEYAIPYYKEDDFANGTEQLFYMVLNEVRQEYGLELVEIPSLKDEVHDLENTEVTDDGAWWEILIGVILFLVIGGLPYLLLIRLMSRLFGSNSDDDDDDDYSSSSSDGGDISGGGSSGGGGAGRSF